MKLPLALMAFGFALPLSAQTLLPIDNASFEDPVYGFGGFGYSNSGPVPGWTTTATGGPDRGVWNTTAGGKEAFQIAFVYGGNSFAQDLSHSILADSIYTVSYVFGRAGTAGIGGRVELWAGGTVANGVVTGGTLLASQTQVSLSGTDMNPFSFVYQTPASGAPVDENLSLRFTHTSAAGTFVSFDNFQVSVAPIPEPASAALALGALGLFGFRRRRN